MGRQESLKETLWRNAKVIGLGGSITLHTPVDTTNNTGISLAERKKKIKLKKMYEQEWHE